MSKKFNKGDTVVLMSGGPLMTVTGYKKLMNPGSMAWEETDEEVECVWFEKNDKKSGVFHQDTIILEKIE